MKTYYDDELKTFTIYFDGGFLNKGKIKSIIESLKSNLFKKDVNLIVFDSDHDDFCLGHDIVELSNMDVTESKMYAMLGQELIKIIKDSKKIFISKLSGKVFGPAFEIALATDIVLATEDTKFAFPETEFGFLPAFGGTALASRKVHENFVKFMTVTNEIVEVGELYCRGIVARIFKDKMELDEYAIKMMKNINEKSLFAIGLAKETINNGIEIDLDKALLLEQNAFAVAFSSYDKKEGMTAFVEKRKPLFKNRWEDFDEFF